MNSNAAKICALAMILAITAFAVSCAGKTIQTRQETVLQLDAGAAKDTPVAVPEPTQPPPASNHATTMAADDPTLFVNDNIHFDFDSHILSDKAQQILTQKAEYLISHPEAEVVVEGHCDERGTGAYNTALGEKRADAAKEFLVYLGINPTRLTTISYGEERPITPDRTEVAWAQNRRAQFLIQ